MMRVLVLGANGMLGHQVVRRFESDFDVAGTVRGSEIDPAFRKLVPRLPLYAGVRAEDLGSVRHAIEDSRADFVINCIGVVKQADIDPASSILVNALLPHQLAQLTDAAGARLIHFSTDCVFSGAHGPYTEADAPDPVDRYGRAKLLGECQEDGVLTLRLSFVGHELQWHRGLIDWFLSQRGGRIKGYAKALYSGLTTIALANLLASLLQSHPTLAGVWHVSGDPISKFDLLQIVNRIYGLGIEIERDEQFACDRRIDSTRFREQTGWHPSPWEDMVRTMFADRATAPAG
jgi:dTDP-4-dehydrorhamnose reductase